MFRTWAIIKILIVVKRNLKRASQMLKTLGKNFQIRDAMYGANFLRLVNATFSTNFLRETIWHVSYVDCYQHFNSVSTESEEGLQKC